jgi:putative phosphoribosyl transferase
MPSHPAATQGTRIFQASAHRDHLSGVVSGILRARRRPSAPVGAENTTPFPRTGVVLLTIHKNPATVFGAMERSMHLKGRGCDTGYAIGDPLVPVSSPSTGVADEEFGLRYRRGPAHCHAGRSWASSAETGVARSPAHGRTDLKERITVDRPSRAAGEERAVRIPVESVTLEGDLGIPEGARGIVLFAHGSGSSRRSPRNRYVARVLRHGGLATLLFDLLTTVEEVVDMRTGHLRFDIGLLASRLIGVTDWVTRNPETRQLRVGYFGASTGAAAALVAAANRPREVGAVVSRGGRPDLAGSALPHVKAPTLLIVGGADAPVITMNQEALEELRVDKKLMIVPGATHLFEEPGALEEVARLALQWFDRYLTRTGEPAQHPAALDEQPTPEQP